MQYVRMPVMVGAFLLGIIVTALLGGCTAGNVGSGGVVTQLVGALGGVITTSVPNTGLLTLTIPPGALTVDTQITVKPLTASTLPKVLPAGNVELVAATFSPDGTVFAAGKPAQIMMPLSPAQTPGIVLPVFFYNPNSGAWELAEQAVVDNTGRIASFTITHFSTYAVARSSQISVVIQQGDQTLTTGDTFQFSAVVNNTTNQLVTWSLLNSNNQPVPGFISPTGLLTAPPTPGTYQVVATSHANTSAKDSVIVTVTPVGTTITTYVGKLTGVDNIGVSVTGAFAGTITSTNQVNLTITYKGVTAPLNANINASDLLTGTAFIPGIGFTITVRGTLQTFAGVRTVTDGIWAINGTIAQGPWTLAPVGVAANGVGHYSGTLSGDDTGSISFDITANGVVSLSAHRTTKNITIIGTGSISDTTAVLLASGADGINTFKTIGDYHQLTHTITGVWTDTDGTSGAWTVVKQ